MELAVTSMCAQQYVNCWPRVVKCTVFYIIVAHLELLSSFISQYDMNDAHLSYVLRCHRVVTYA